MKKRWSKNEVDFLIKNYYEGDKEFLLENISRSWNAIVLKSNQLKLKRSDEFHREGKMSTLLNDTKESFYWVGFLLADGHFFKNRINLKISNLDLNHLIKFSKFIQCDNIRVNNQYCSVSVQNKEIFKNLCNKYDIKNTKTYNPPDFNLYKNFNDELLFCLIIGFIDGDGCIKKVHKRKDCSLSIRLHRSWVSNLLFIESFLFDYFKLKKNKILSRVGNDGYAILNISNNKLINLIKKEVVRIGLPFMDRKWGNIEENRILRDDLIILNNEKVLELYKSNYKPKDIIEKLNLKPGIVYKYIREYKKRTN